METKQLTDNELKLNHQNEINQRTINALAHQISELSKERANFAAQTADAQEKCYSILQENQKLIEELEKLRDKYIDEPKEA